MYILSDRWQDGYLDYYRPDDHVRIQVLAWWAALPITDMFMPQPRDLRKVWNYAREVGLRMVIRKAMSRSAEGLRDTKVLAIGVGTVVESDASGAIDKGTSVVFIAPCHPPCVERVVLPPELIASTDPTTWEQARADDGILYTDEPIDEQRYDELAGWTEYSGSPLPDSVPLLLRDAADRWRRFDPGKARILNLPQPTEIREHTAARGGPGGLKAVLFGLAARAKTLILPNLPQEISVTCVHEIEPTQVGPVHALPWGVDVCPILRPAEKYDVFLIAGYHHTHAALAVHALESGAWAVVEKPVVTTWQELDSLMVALERNPSRLFSAFQKRYSPLWAWAREDLGVRPGEPIHYHCIVFEVPLPRRHWYNWPNSHSRIVSNGCHWIDHFLFLNKFSRPERYDLWKANNGDVHVSIELDNGAVFGMHLTDQGSKRIGMQEHVELRANGITVKVDNASRYIAEGERGILRRDRISKVTPHNRMYQSIYRKIIRGEPGDDILSIRRSCEAMLRLEDLHASL